MIRFMLPMMLFMVAAVAVYATVMLARGQLGVDRAPTGLVEPEPTDRPRDPFRDVADPGGDPRALSAGDMLDYLGERSWVRGSLRISARDDSVVSWSSHLLEMPDTRRWLTVSDDGEPQLDLWSPASGTGTEPGGATLTVDGTAYRLRDSGQGRYRSEGTTGRPASGSVEYLRYGAANGSGLLFERYDGGTWQVSGGTPVRRDALVIYPRG